MRFTRRNFIYLDSSIVITLVLGEVNRLQVIMISFRIDYPAHTLV